MMKKIILIACAALLLASFAEKSSDELTFMSFNIRNSSAWKQDGDNDWAHRREAVVKMIRKEKPDALGMQEMLPDQLAYLDSALAKEYGRIGVGRDDGISKGENMCIYYRKERLDLMDWHTRWLSSTPDSVSFGWDAACRRTATIARFRDLNTGKELVYINTHLDHVGQVARASSTQLLALWADEYGKNMPVIIGGDMNSGLEDTIFSNLYHNGLTEARDLLNLTDTCITYNAYGKGKPSQIDHFFVRNVDVKEFRTLNGDYGVPYISDHYPVIIKFNN